ncbi:Chromosome transmission fidelity protein 18-like protein [Hypsibius exemplaris]|uniref:Chromosome transmission fidelity protein 18-like protein n=1 Tax=Hypsibius exemplaris TaxID=2072580 RepID=A0A1W0X404_HYPEX|nr:Chromosome transmission fidelity protein 18-like protein [Hypsibius exemplaris]
MPAVTKEDSPWDDWPDFSDEETNDEPVVARPVKKKNKTGALGLDLFMTNMGISSAAAAPPIPPRISHSTTPVERDPTVGLFSGDIYYPGLEEESLEKMDKSEHSLAPALENGHKKSSVARALFSLRPTAPADIAVPDVPVIPHRTMANPPAIPEVFHQQLSEAFEPESLPRAQPPQRPSGYRREASPARPLPPTPVTSRLRVWRVASKTLPQIPVLSGGTNFFLRLKPANWRKELVNEFASTTAVTITSHQSSRQFANLLLATRQQMEIDAELPVDSVTGPVESLQVEFKNMWVEKYRPERYMDLLSDEGVNRCLLHWLKLWDAVVFKKEAAFLNPYKDYGKRKKRDDKPVYDRRKYGGVSDFCFTVDADKRPRFKAALLCGPPGLGKTSLAQVIARHAGYEPMEINASDDRALEVFRSRVEATVMNGSVVNQFVEGGERPDRPKCLIIDEIDGAPGNTVEYLVCLLKGEAKATEGKKKKKIGLWRPIICICNDLYVPALRTLRQCTMILRFPSINRERLTGRLSDICKHLAVQADSAVLYTLCEKSDDDIRTCLNSLQFASVPGKRLHMQDVAKATMGCKDQRKQLLQIWEDIFRLPSGYKGSDTRTGPLHTKSGLSPSDRIGTILEMVQLGEMEKIVNGLFENYLLIHHKDPSLRTAHECADWRSYTDIMERCVYEDQNWFLLGYLSFYPVAIHLLLAALATPRFTFPTAQYETYKKTIANQEIIKALLKDLAPALLRTSKSENLPSEVIPFLTHIIQPPLKAVTTHLLSNAERLDLKRVVHLMISYGLSYQEEKTLTGIHTEKMEPQLDAIASWHGVNTYPGMPTTVRAMVSKEVQQQRINVNARMEGTKSGGHDGEPANMEVDITQDAPAPALPAGVASKANPSTTTRAQANSNNTAKLQVWSVYDCYRKNSPATAPKAGGSSKARKIWFRYKEGYSNAVCRDIKVKDLL